MLARPHRRRSGAHHGRTRRFAVGRLSRFVAALLVALLASTAAAISYTVQVIAVSDRENAIQIYRELARDGYPAYVVRTTDKAGDVYRVRVGAFANRAAALRYAEAMPAVGGSSPVPALAEAIPEGIMPLAPRLIWQHEWSGEDVRVLPWPFGMALRVQRLDPLRQAQYILFQGGEERHLEAWAVVPLRLLPEASGAAPLPEIPLVDLTVRREEPASTPERDDAADAAPEGDEAAVAPEGDEAAVAPEGDADDDAGADAEEGVETEGDERVEPRAASVGLSRYALEPGEEVREEGLALLRDRSLWPPSWEGDGGAVRETFRASVVTLVARDLEIGTDAVEALSYLPGGEPPPALVVLDVTGRSARDTGALLALADPHGGLPPEGPDLVPGDDGAFDMPAWPSTRIDPAATAPDAALASEAWTATGDGAFVRLTLPDGATWRAGVGTPVWSDGRYLLAWDGRFLLLYEFALR
jgi:hypothetical protein